MDPIRKSISDVKYAIPKAVLDAAFMDRYLAHAPLGTSLDSQIENLVIRGRVMIDCDLVGGIQTLIPLENLPQEDAGSNTIVVRIPKTLTQGKRIISVLNLNYTNSAQMLGYNGYGMAGAGLQYSPGDNTVANTLMSNVMSSMDRIPVTSTSAVRLIAENTIAVQDGLRLAQGGSLLCMLANDDNMANIHPRSYHQFSQLVTWAVKSYVYNTLIVELDVGALKGGFQLGVIKTIIEGYSDSEQGYQDYLHDVWSKVALMNDTASYRRLLRTVMGGAR